MLFAHGFGADQTFWRFVAPHFADRYRTILFDHAGCGQALPSAYDVQRHSELQGYVDDLLSIGRAFASEPFVLVGHSIGTIIGLLASIQAPELFARLVLVAASARYMNDPPDYWGGLDEADVASLLALMEQNFLGWATTFAGIAAKDPVSSQALLESFCRTDPRAIRRFAEVAFRADIRAQLPRVTVPSLLLQCALDDIAPIAAGEYMRQHLKDCQYRVLPIAGHCPQMSAPALITSTIDEYLSTSLDARPH